MQRSHSAQLENLRTKIANMGVYTQKALGLVLQALVEKRLDLFD